MRNIKSKTIVFLLVLGLLITGIPVTGAAAYKPPYTTLKVGLHYGTSGDDKAVPCANLLNAAGSGYEFGYFDSSRNFKSIGITTAEKGITILKDKNMVYAPGSADYISYVEGTNGSSSTQVGCYHIKLKTAYSSYSAMQTTLAKYSNSFPKYENGSFYVCVGSYTSSSAATSGAKSLGITSNYEITAGTNYTITVVVTGTNKIIMEYDCGSGTSAGLGVMPKVSSSIKAQTWFRGYRYYGGFQYARQSSNGNFVVVNYVSVEDYVKGVLPYEMSASWPKEALKAQAVCARSYAMKNINKHNSGYGFDVCSTASCQVYRGLNSANSNSDAAVNETAGQYLFYNGELCETYFHSSDGGATENSENVWTAAYGYLRGVKDPYEATVAGSISNYYWSVTYTGSQLTTMLKNKGYSCTTIVDCYVSQYTNVGNVYTMTFVDANGKTINFSKNSVTSFTGIRSQRFTILGGSKSGTVPTAKDIYVNSSSGVISGGLNGLYAEGSSGTATIPTGDVYAITDSGVEKVQTQTSGTAATGKMPPKGSFTFTGTGWGHNVGMSQWGAYSMAKYHNKTYKDILSFYYTGTQIVTA